MSKFLATMNYDVVPSTGLVSQEEAQNKAYSEYEKFRIIQDKTYISDFDRFNDKKNDSGQLLPLDIDL